MGRSGDSDEGTGALHRAVEPLVLDDGTAPAVRQLSSADGPELARSIERLSDESRYQRFAAPLPRVSQRLIEQLVSVDHLHQEALVAIDPVSRDGIAVARFAEEPDDPTVVEVAFTVDDSWQGRGIGSEMLDRILARALETGHREARASVLAENRKSLQALEHAGFRRRGPPGTMLELECRLGDSAA
jgi:RimJ/RimL family protein N-acetyltransferase